MRLWGCWKTQSDRDLADQRPAGGRLAVLDVEVLAVGAAEVLGAPAAQEEGPGGDEAGLQPAGLKRFREALHARILEHTPGVSVEEAVR